MEAQLPSELLWLVDNLASFSTQLAAILMLTALGALLSRSPRLGLALIFFAAPFAGLVAASALNGAPVGVCSGDAARLRVVTVNLLAWNRDGDAVEAFIYEAEPDVIATQETTEWWDARLDSLAGDYPYRSKSRGGETQLFSKRPFIRTGRGSLSQALPRSTMARIEVGGLPVSIASVHLLKPLTAADGEIRRRQMSAIASASAEAEAFVVMGDFNAAPTSLDFRSLLAASPLRAPALQFPPVTTWPSKVPAIGLQIDHVLATPDFHFERVAPGPWVGSNHLPVIADLALAGRGGCGT